MYFFQKYICSELAINMNSLQIDERTFGKKAIRLIRLISLIRFAC